MKQSPLTSENELILHLARGKVPPPLAQRARAVLSAQLDWDAIIERLKTEEIYPLFYRNLASLGCPGVPETIRKKLHDLTRINIVRNTLLTEELKRILSLLGGAGIPTIPLKGVALAKLLYGDPTARVAGDIDILVPFSSVKEALCLLLAGGYQIESEELFFEDLIFHSDSIEYGLMREQDGCRCALELHWGIMWGASVDREAVEDLWLEAHPRDFFGVQSHALSPEWELLFLAAHAARHEWQGLKWLVDIHEVCSSPRLDWKKVADKATTFKLKKILSLTLSACQVLFGTAIPAEYQLKGLPSWLKLFPHSEGYRFWHNTWVRVYLLSRFRDKLRFILRGLFVPTPAERRWLRLPSFLGPLYYPLRPLRLGFKWSRSLVKHSLAASDQRSEVGGQMPEIKTRKSEVSFPLRATCFELPGPITKNRAINLPPEQGVNPR